MLRLIFSPSSITGASISVLGHFFFHEYNETKEFKDIGFFKKVTAGIEPMTSQSSHWEIATTFTSDSQYLWVWAIYFRAPKCILKWQICWSDDFKSQPWAWMTRRTAGVRSGPGCCWLAPFSSPPAPSRPGSAQPQTGYVSKNISLNFGRWRCYLTDSMASIW